MRNINNDLTLKRNYLNKYRFLISEYEQVKRGEHARFRFAKEFYTAHDTDPRSFLKYYHLFKQSGDELDLLPDVHHAPQEVDLLGGQREQLRLPQAEARSRVNHHPVAFREL